jgi:light-regulated signal transduction histidine kinase (bacteriophytochrome)
MHYLLNAMLDYVEIDMSEEDFADTDCEALLVHTLRELEQEIRESGAQITHDPLPIVWANAPRFKLVFRHLIANALKFRTTIPPQVHVSAEYRENEWRFMVRDNGIGIEPPYGERVFEMFARLHTQAAYPGTGMGLTLCKKVIGQHGGRIWVEPAQDQGSTFIFTVGHKRSGKEQPEMQRKKS